MTLGKNTSFRRAVLIKKGYDGDFIDEVLSCFASYDSAVSLFEESGIRLSYLRAYQIITAEAKIAALMSRGKESEPPRGDTCYTKLSEKILSKVQRPATFFRRLFCPVPKE